MYIYHFIYVLFRLNMEVDRMGSARKPASHLYPVAPPFDIAYRNGKVSSPARPHTHNAAEIYYTLTDLHQNRDENDPIQIRPVKSGYCKKCIR